MAKCFCRMLVTDQESAKCNNVFSCFTVPASSSSTNGNDDSGGVFVCVCVCVCVRVCMCV